MRYRARCCSNAGRATWPGARARAQVCECACVCLLVGAQARSPARAWPHRNHSRPQLNATEELRTAVGAQTLRPREAARTWAELWPAATIGQDTMRSSVREARHSTRPPATALMKQHSNALQALGNWRQAWRRVAPVRRVLQRQQRAAAVPCSALPKLDQYQQGRCAICHGNAPRLCMRFS